jgi:hypothetical protein
MKPAVCVLFFVACLMSAQTQPAAPAAPAPAGTDLAALVKQQFGSTFALQPKFATPIITADFDGDGVEDAAIVAVSQEPFPDSFQFKYTVVDPYNSYFGMSNPNLSASFSTVDPTRNHELLVILGSGPDAWHAAVPKAKWVMINVPFDEISAGRMLIRKDRPPIFVIKVKEAELMDACVYWDAKKKRWRWQPGDTLQ